MPPSGCKTGGKVERKSSEVDTKAISRRHNELLGNFKMVACDVISIREQVMEYMYLPTGIKREFVASAQMALMLPS